MREYYLLSEVISLVVLYNNIRKKKIFKYKIKVVAGSLLFCFPQPGIGNLTQSKQDFKRDLNFPII